MLAVRTTDGNTLNLTAEPVASGVEKVVFFTTDKKYAVALYFGSLGDRNERAARLKRIIDNYNPTQSDPHAATWKQSFCWPIAMVDGGDGMPDEFCRAYNLAQPLLGIVAPIYPQNFFFTDISGQRREKKLLWFTGGKTRRRVPKNELGTTLQYLQCCLRLARAVRRLHSAGLAHTDLSHNNVLIDPSSGEICVIDLDGLAIPGISPPTVNGTPRYMAPEIVEGNSTPSIHTDLHSLAVLIYQMLLQRHPLEGPLVHSASTPEDQERLEFGANALFVENSKDRRNWLSPSPDIRVAHLGPHLEELFRRAFEVGLHSPEHRPIAGDWELALSRTLDLVHPAVRRNEWMVIHPRMKDPLRCPHTRRYITRSVFILEYFKEIAPGSLRSEQVFLSVFEGRALHIWHLDAGHDIYTQDRSVKAVFEIENDRWYLRNKSGKPISDFATKHEYADQERIPLSKNLRLQFSGSNKPRIACFWGLEATRPASQVAPKSRPVPKTSKIERSHTTPSPSQVRPVLAPTIASSRKSAPLNPGALLVAAFAVLVFCVFLLSWQTMPVVELNPSESLVPVAAESKDEETIPLKIGRIAISSNRAKAAYEINPALVSLPNQTIHPGRWLSIFENVPVGRYEITARLAGWPDLQKTLDVTEGQIQELRFDFIGGAMLVNSTPSGATVEEDGVKLGVTPLSLQDQVPQSRQLFLRYSDWNPIRSQVTVVAGRTAEHHVRFPHGSVRVFSQPEGADVSIAGQSFGVTPLHIPLLPAGSSQIRLTLDGHAPKDVACIVLDSKEVTVETALVPILAPVIKADLEPSANRPTLSVRMRGSDSIGITNTGETDVQLLFVRLEYIDTRRANRDIKILKRLPAGRETRVRLVLPLIDTVKTLRFITDPPNPEIVQNK